MAEQVHGRIIDVDAHAMLMPDAYEAILGAPYGEPLRRWAVGRIAGLDPETLDEHRARSRGDIFRVKGWLAHGADDPDERVDALDRMGVARQIVFPPVPMPFLHGASVDAAVARARYNDAMLDWSGASSGRLVPVMQLGLADLEDAFAEAERLIGRGARAVEIPFAKPPADRSPADPTWDQLWATLADNRVTVLFHIGGGGLGGGLGPSRSFTDPRYGATDRLRPHDPSAGVGDLEPHDPGSFTRLGPIDRVLRHHAAETFVSALILGGVLQRWPSLTVGIIELGAGWVGSWAEQMDVAAAAMATYGLAPLDERPSTYLSRNVRITPTYGEPVGAYIDRTGLDDVYAFSTDYPHYEGGKDPIGWSRQALAGAGDDQVEKWFVTNGSLLLHD